MNLFEASIMEAALNPWIKKFGKYKLNAFPPATIDKKAVKVDLTGDINTHWVLFWRDPVTGRRVRAYTKEFMDNSAKNKWDRVQKAPTNLVDTVNKKLESELNDSNPDINEAAAILLIINNTGHRPGSKGGLAKTGNRGVYTLHPDNVKVNGDLIKIDFTGKSYAQNSSVFKNKALADYLKKLKAKRKGQDMLFSIKGKHIKRSWKRISGGKLKVKDLRTITAINLAKEILAKAKLPNIPKGTKPIKIKRIVKKFLKDEVFTKVAAKLSNTPGMAKGSYVAPAIIDQWLKKQGIQPKLMTTPNKELKKESIMKLSVFMNLNEQTEQEEKSNMIEPKVYPLPDWWDDDSIELIKI